MFSLVTPGHLLSPDLFLNYRHMIEYVLFVQSLPTSRRDSLNQLWTITKSYRWGPFYRLTRAAKFMGVHVEDPFIFIFDDTALSIDEPLEHLKHRVRNSDRQLLLR